MTRGEISVFDFCKKVGIKFECAKYPYSFEKELKKIKGITNIRIDSSQREDNLWFDYDNFSHCVVYYKDDDGDHLYHTIGLYDTDEVTIEKLKKSIKKSNSF